MTISKSKRLHLTIYTLIANFIIFGFGISMGTDLASLGTGLALLNAPLYGYLFGETIRPSGKKVEPPKEKKTILG